MSDLNFLRSEEWEKGKKSLKIGGDKHTPKPIQFFYSNNYLSKHKDFTVQRQEFLFNEAPPHTKDLAKATKILEALSFTVGDRIEFDIIEFRRDQSIISLAKHAQGCSLKIKEQYLDDTFVTDVLNELSAVNIDDYFDHWFKINYNEN